MMLLQLLHEPQLIGILHMTEIVFFKLLLLLFDAVANVTDIPEHFRNDRMHFNFNLSVAKDLPTGLKSSLVRRHQHNIDFFILKHLPSLQTLYLAFLRQCRVHVVLSIAADLLEPRHVETFLPIDSARIYLFALEVVQEGFVEE
jgi:hypothetical protein